MRAGIIAFGLMIGWWAMPHTAAAGVAITTKNTTWETAAKLGVITEQVQLYGALGSAGDARFYQLTVKKVGSLNAAIDVPVWATKKFHPQLVLYQPDSATVGPPLVMVQPPGTIALVYPQTTEHRRFEPWTQISTINQLQAKLDLPVTGTYYLAVYNADQSSGRFRLTLTPSTNAKTNGVLAWPRCWWISQIWANPTIMTLFAPLVFIAIIMAAFWTGMHWSKPVTKKSRPKKKIPLRAS